MLFQAVVGLLVVTALTAFDFHVPGWNEVAVGCISGFFAAVASLMQVFAYRHAPASLLSPFTYTQLMWAAGFGFLAFGTVPGPSMLDGAAVIASRGIYTAWRETVRARAGRGRVESPERVELLAKKSWSQGARARSSHNNSRMARTA